MCIFLGYIEVFKSLVDKEVSIGQMAYDFPKISQAAFENYCTILFPTECYSPYALRFHGVMVSTLDF